MRRRLIATYVGLLALVLLGLSVPLAAALMTRNEQTMFIDRINDTARFASLAEPALRGSGEVEQLENELRQYEQNFGIVAGIVGRDGRVFATSESVLDVEDELVKQAINTALSGHRGGPEQTVWPWTGDAIVVSEPIGRGGEVIGAALTVSPTAGLRAAIARSWALLAAIAILVLLLGWVATLPLARSVLRPIERLDEATRALADGRYSGGPLADSGPPELRRLAESFTVMADRVTTLLGRQSTFASYASHQLRTPLATLRLCVENLRPSVGQEGIEDYTLLADEIERMARMCDALLSYALAEVAASERHTLDAVAVADARIAVWRPAAEQAGISLRRRGAATAPVCAADEVLDQVLDALLSNAIKFAGYGAEVTIDIYQAAPDRVEVHVIDTGPGMPPEDLARAKEAFWRKPSHQNIDGSGLGITIAEALIKASGGSLHFGPADPHGVHARVVVPSGER
jgi:signal transduction histidine kinase